MAKLIYIIGITSNQEDSVALRFQDPSYRVRGVTRDPTSLAA